MTSLLIRMGIYSSFLRFMGGWFQLTTRFQKYLERMDVPTGPILLRSRKMYSIIIIEQLKLTPKGDLAVVALLENEERDQKGTFLFTAPAVAPIRAKSVIYKETLPPGVSFQGKGTREWKQLIDDHQLFIHQQWTVVDEIEQPREKDDPQSGGRLFF